MSTPFRTLPVAEAQEGEAVAHRVASPLPSPSRQRKLVTGYSVLARGEPFVWLSGGMLVICLAMLIGLMTILLVNGLSTFWPVRLRMIPLRNGGFVAGEWQYDEPYFRTSMDPNAAQGDAQRDVDPPLTEQTPDPRTRQFLRTGCAEILGKHFRFVDQEESYDGDFLLPKDYWLIERQKGGRFYGLSVQLAERLQVEDDLPLRSYRHLKGRLETWFGGVGSGEAEPQGTLEALQNAEANAGNRDGQKLLATLAKIERKRLEFLDGEWREKQANLAWSYESDSTSLNVSNETLSKDGLIPVRRLVNDQEVPLCLMAWLNEQSRARGRMDQLQQEIATMDQRRKAARQAVRKWELANKQDWSEVLQLGMEEVDRRVELTRTSQRDRQGLESLRKQLANPSSEEAFLVDSVARQLQQVEKEIQVERQASQDKQTQMLADRIAEAAPRKVIGAYLDQMEQAEVFQGSKLEQLKALESQLATRDWLVAISEGEVKEVKPWLAEQESVLTTHPLGSLLSVTPTLGDRQYLWKSQGPDGGDRFHVLSQHRLPIESVVRVYQPNQLSTGGCWGVYASRWWEFVSQNPRDANTEGGVFPAIWGTIVMTLIMSLVVVPFGVMAALYLREYAKPGLMVSVVRICINNLAGVPSIVYGVFGLAFFCYLVGGFIDGGPKRIAITPWPSGTWFLGLFGLSLLSFTAFILSLSHSQKTERRHAWLRRMATLLWFASVFGVLVLLIKSPFFHGFYETALPAPTFGKGALLWAALTLALLTLPVVIVATEEALSAVPNSLREGSYACGASKWQTIYRIVLPHARPGILTGSILAMARGAGEVAPLMLLGAIPTAIDLPLDTEFPFLHGDRSFMHLGFQIFSQGFQSQNSDAARPMVFTTTVLLLLIVVLLNLLAIWLRARLRKSFAGSQF